MKKQNAAIWCALLLIALPIAVLLLVPSPSARIVDVVQPLMESEEIDYWNPDIFFLTKYGLTAAVSALCGLALTLLCSRKRLSLDTRAAICTVAGFGALVGARVLYMLARYSYIMVDLGGSSFFWQFWQGGYTLYGGILGGMGAIALYAKLTKQKALPLLDAVTPGALLALCGLRLAEGFTGQGFSKQMDDICWYFLPFQNEDGQMLVWAYEAIVAAVALVIVLVQGRRQKIAGRTLETGLTIISVMQVLLDSWRADELIRFGFVRLNMLMAALTLAVLLTRCIRRDGLKGISIARIVMLLLGAGVCIAVEFALDKSAINNGILYGVMMLALVPMFIAVLLDDGRIQTAEERK